MSFIVVLAACAALTAAVPLRQLSCLPTQFMGCMRADECLCMPLPKLDCSVAAQCGETLFEEVCRLNDPRDSAKCVKKKCTCVAGDKMNPDPKEKAFKVIQETLNNNKDVTKTCLRKYIANTVRMPADLLVAVSRDPMMHYKLLCGEDEKKQISIVDPQTRKIMSEFRYEEKDIVEEMHRENVAKRRAAAKKLKEAQRRNEL
jgi:hypothetical protein